MQNHTARASELVIAAGLRRFLYLTAGLAGASVLVIEILGAKMLAPYFGTSHFVWTAQISVTLIALAAGYYAGGWLADRSPQLDWLFRLLLVAALVLSLEVRFCENLCYLCLRLPFAWGSLAAAAALFFLPLTLLAMVTPFLVRVLTASIQGIGRQVGRLSCVSTLGSVAGALLIGYALIPFLPNSVIMHLTALILALLAGTYFLFWSASSMSKSSGLTLALLGVALSGVAIQKDLKPPTAVAELYRANSNFGLMQVWQSSEDRRYYLNDFLTQNTYDPLSKQSVSLFTYMLHGLALAYRLDLTNALCIGMGVGIVPSLLASGGAKVDVVEINPRVVPLAQRFFDLDTARLNIVIGDGRDYLNRCAKKYDAVILDAFLGDSSPSHLLSREAMVAIKQVLNASGVLVINAFGEFEPGRDFFCASLEKTLRTVFPALRIHDGGTGNVFFVASCTPHLPASVSPRLEHVHPVCVEQVKTAFSTLRSTRPEAGMVLTDDYNPVDFYDAANRERLRRMLAMSMKWTEE